LKRILLSKLAFIIFATNILKIIHTLRDSNPKLKLPNLNQIFYEDHFDDKISKNTMKDILTSFFYFEKFYVYEGIDDKNNLIYYNATSKKIK
jgi:hypothetical protein